MKQVYYLCRERETNKEYLLTEEALKVLRDLVHHKIIKVVISAKDFLRKDYIKEVWYVDASRQGLGLCGLYCTFYIPVWEDQALRVPNPNFRQDFRQHIFSKECVSPRYCAEIELSMGNFRKDYKDIEIIE